MSEPLAVVGVACRMPGGINDLNSLWNALLQRRDLVGRIPADRFDTTRHIDPDPARPGRSYVDAGGFLDDIVGFDAEHFGISPREAGRMDPQQRIMLELTAEALDDAAIDPATLAGSDTGVFVGLSNTEYWQMQHADPDSITAYTNLGGLICVVPNRISYAFDLHGPSLAVDTACSSSLVALHQAADHLRTGRGRVALAGAVNVLLSPYTFVGFAKASMLSPTGRCHAFSDRADGYVRSEGAGLVVLKRLSDALADGDRVHAVLWGSGTNSDGRTAGMSLPSPAAQEALLRQVHRDFAVGPDELVYFEAHGTGTAVGDPVECAAIGGAIGTRRREPLPVGSVKTNVGHLEAAAGMAGLMKALLVLRHGVIPASLHGTPHNPGIDFAGLGLTPVDEHRPLAPTGRSLVGISAYGFGGTNAHAVLGAAPAQPPSTPATGPVPIMVSARTETALRSAAKALAERAEAAEDGYDLAWTTTRRRGRHALRAAAFTGDSLTEATPTRAVSDGRIAFVFAGNGSQYARMGTDLYAAEPVFAAALDAVDAELAGLLGWSVVEELHAPPPSSRLAATEVAQPCLFAVQVGLVELLADKGVRPDAVCGHSVGEIAAAYVAGALDLAQAARLVWARSSAQARTVGTGMMAAVGLGAADAEAALAPFAGRLEIAGVNSDRDVTVAGEFAALDEFGLAMIERGVFFRPLALDYAFHSHLMDPAEASLKVELGGLSPVMTRLPFVSTVTCTEIAGPELDAGYWWRNLRHPVQFAAAVKTLVGQGFGTFLEIGPQPILRHYLKSMVDGVVFDTAHRDEPGPARLRAAVAGLIACGAKVDTDRHFPSPGRVTDLPIYPWQRQRHWNGGPRCWDGGVRDHPLLGDRTDKATPTWQGTLEPGQASWLADHVVDGTVLMPGAAYVEMALTAAERALDAPVDLHALHILAPLSLDGRPPRLDVSCREEDGVVRVAARGEGAADWRTVARCRAHRRVADPPADLDLGIASTAPVDPYLRLAEVGLTYGAAFRVLTGVCVGDGEVLATYVTDLPLDGYRVHPVILDGALQAALMLPAVQAAFLPVAVEEVRYWRSPGATGHARVRLRSLTERELCADIVITGSDGAVAVELNGFRARRLDRAGWPITRLVTELRAAPLPEPAPPSPYPDLALPETTAPADAATVDATPALTGHFTVRAIRELLPGATEFTMADLAAAGVRNGRFPFLRALLNLTVELGHAERAGDGWRLTGTDGLDFDTALRQHSGSVAQLTLVGRAGRHLPALLCGDADPVELFFAETSLETVRHLYDLDPISATANRRAREVVGALTARWPADGPLRVLEIGAGTGGLTGALLPVLPRERTRYTFTDVSDAFFAKAADRFTAYDFVEHRRLDIDCDPAEQGFVPGGYDLVVAANSLHATPDLRRSLRHVAELLADGGHLLMLESEDLRTKLLPWGLFDDYWTFTDTDLRTGAVLQGPRWRTLLAECGFGDMAVPHTDGDLTLTLARRTDAPLPCDAALPAPTQPWLVLLEEPGEETLAAELAVLLGGQVVRTPDQCAREGAAIVLLFADRTDDDPVDVTVDRVTLLQRIVAAQGATALALVTRPTGIHPAPDEPSTPVDAAMWAALRGLRAEGTDLRLRKISLARGDDTATRLARELLTGTTEDEVVLTRAGRFVPRLVPPRPATRRPPAGYTVRLTDPGPAHRLDWVEMPVPTPGPGQLLVEVRATGLNYRDVLQTSGIVTDEMVEGGLAGAALGLEFAGVVAESGAGVNGFRPGDRVFGYASACLSSHVLAPAGLLARIPEGMSCAAAATLPVCYLVAGYLDPIGPGRTVLVHAAAGATGLAAVQHAQARGAAVIATAGTPEKRDFLHLIGVEHVLDSRSLAFADQVRRLTGGRGVDVVLNSLAGEAIPLGLGLLAPGGRFIEIGKRDLYADHSIPLRPFRNNVTFTGIHLDQLALLFPEETARRFADLADRARAGVYPALPYRTFPADRIAEAFTVLRHSRHLGKIVITFEEPPPVVTASSLPRLDPDGTYLVTGGTSGLGAASVDWLAERGARHIALLGRRTVTAPDHPSATITTYAADVSDEAALRQVIIGIDATGHALRGVVHAANTLADGLLANLTPDRIRAGLAAKLGGAAVLHRLTAGRDLNLFVTFSSINGVYGYIGQVSYAAANVYLDALARHRAAAGLPALSVALGGIGDTGILARDARAAELLANHGVGPMSAREVFATLDELLTRDVPASVAARQDWTAGAPHHLRNTPRLRSLLPEPDRPDTPGPDSADAEDVEGALAALIAHILHTSVDQLDHDRALPALGVDSLMATEISEGIRRRFDVEIPTMRIIGGATITELARTFRAP
ncbi:type I polyketide synthase [Streptomyces coacervatus]|uniref:Type I polyketide synthase n=1 Tax=Streptomyces coacervatus TaxID=647381 RepID=A0ABP7H7R1_9ACTN|nr:type I polyketide synthase [Streptomyces coacervatus]MDF2267364.1 SDR family NAD(P)-dependent oxidoreductase [Streptomyces coacervatus]